MIYMLTGVSGVGKTTIGLLLSEQLKIPFYDADDFHPKENVLKMSSGIPLLDEDRSIWLQTLGEKLPQWEEEGGAVLACSALKEIYRSQLQTLPRDQITWIFLHSQYEVILHRLKSRENHYFKPSLLQSQYDTLEIPQDGIHINVNKSLDEIIQEIMNKLTDQKSEIGLLGLGVMGRSLAINFASKGIRTAVFNRHLEGIEVDIAKNFATTNKELYTYPWFDNLESFVQALERPRKIVLMVHAGRTVDIVLEDLVPFLEAGDIIIDGGNSHYKDTVKRERELKEKGILFVGVGISGGEEGAMKGPSIMPGGSPEAYKQVGGYLERIAARDQNGQACCTYIGPDGAGHFVKMLHNGIEYGEMQLIAECYHYMRFGMNLAPQRIAGIFEQWNQHMKSYLLEISAAILHRKEEGAFLIDKILDAAKQKGTGGWSTNAALELGVPFDTITAAVMARSISAKKDQREEAMELYQFPTGENTEELSNDLFLAYQSASIINHAIGFSLLTEASREYKWELNLSEIARIWTSGCIIRSAFMEELIAIFRDIPSSNLLTHPAIVRQIQTTKPVLCKLTARILSDGYAAPVFSAATNYLLGFTASQSSANMIQAQRDYFGAHTYERTDRPRGTFFHTNWKPLH